MKTISDQVSSYYELYMAPFINEYVIPYFTIIATETTAKTKEIYQAASSRFAKANQGHCVAAGVTFTISILVVSLVGRVAIPLTFAGGAISSILILKSIEKK